MHKCVLFSSLKKTNHQGWQCRKKMDLKFHLALCPLLASPVDRDRGLCIILTTFLFVASESTSGLAQLN